MCVGGSYSTAPNSPDISSLSVPLSDTHRDSYDQAVKNTDVLWEWHTGPAAEGQQVNISNKIKEQSSPPVPKHISSVGRHASLGNTPSTLVNSNMVPAVVNSSNARVQIGFDPPISATSLSSLPGTDVITSPPHPSNKPSTPKTPKTPVLSKPLSIEELDEQRQNYVPDIRHPIAHEDSPDYDTNPLICLDLSSITGHYSNLVISETEKKEKREKEPMDDQMMDTEEKRERVINGEPRSTHSSQETKRRSLSFDMRDVVGYYIILSRGQVFVHC